MDSLYRAELRMRDIDAREKDLENKLIECLEHNDRTAAAAVEQQIEDLKRERLDEQTLIDYYHQQGEHQSNTDLFTLHYRSVRIPAHHDVEELSKCVTNWSETNKKNDVTGLLVATDTTFFGSLEGPKAAVEQIYARLRQDPGHKNCHIMSSQRIEQRTFAVGLKLSFVEDENISQVMQELQHRIAYAERYAPARVLDVVSRGGDALSLVPQVMPCAFVVCVMLDSLAGAIHKGGKYVSAAKKIFEIAATLGGEVVEHFGETMSIVFPKHGTATPAVTAAKRILDEVRWSIVAVASGAVTLVSTPQTSALGVGLRDAKKLVLLVEHERRPLIITTGVQDNCSHAFHKFQTYTIDNVLYYTLAAVGDARLEVPPEPTVIHTYSGLEPVTRTSDNAIDFKPPTAAELQAKRQAEAIVPGAMTNKDLHDSFRHLDIGNVGWVSKEKFRAYIATESLFPVFEHDLVKLDQWMERCNSLGDNRISFDEYALLCLKLQAA